LKPSLAFNTSTLAETPGKAIKTIVNSFSDLISAIAVGGNL
jgi:hypothetical protein